MAKTPIRLFSLRLSSGRKERRRKGKTEKRRRKIKGKEEDQEADTENRIDGVVKEKRKVSGVPKKRSFVP